jgi:hypothetical protein
VQDLLAKNYACFVHFCTNGVIRAQQDHALSPPTSQWQLGQIISDGPWNVSLPASLPDGDYDWLIGLFDATGDGSRVPLQGLDDGTLRIRLGGLHLTNSGTLITFTAETNLPAFDPSAWYGQHLNNSNTVVDFGDARTDGSIWLHREANAWLLKTWPRQRNFTLEFSRARFDQPAKVQCTGGAASTVTPVPSGSRWVLPLNGASEYRWTNPPPRLSIVRTNAAELVSWPASADNFLLEATTDLAPPANWNPVTNPVTNINGQLSVLLPTLGAKQFHRLKLLQ